jgi:trimeric autotransporter adhesin
MLFRSGKRFTGISGIMFLAVTASTILLPGCPSDKTSNPAQATLTSIAVTPANTSIAPGTTIPLVATGTYSNNSHRIITTSVTWNSSNPATAGISNAAGTQGVATATSAIGSTTITASVNGISGVTSLSTSTVASIAVTPVTTSIAPGTTQQFTATGTLASTNQQNLTSFAAWMSSSPGIANIDPATGLATAASASNSATITASYTGVTGTATLIASPVASISLAPTSATIAKGTTQQFSATGTLSNSATQTLTSWATWASSSTPVATISAAGLATGAGQGVSLITAEFDTKTSSAATLTVTAAIITSITITPASAGIALGQTKQFTARGAFSDASTQDISSSATWLSSSTGVATINASGLADSVGIGTTSIIATASGITSNAASLAVTQAQLVSIIVTPLTPTIVITSGIITQQFTATGTYTNGDILDLTASVTWASSKTSVATINSHGLAAAPSFVNATDSTHITATLSGITSNSATLTVSEF